jgi:hypothetical protein
MQRPPLFVAWPATFVGGFLSCSCDVNGDGTTSGDDLAIVLAAWGACS